MPKLRTLELEKATPMLELVSNHHMMQMLMLQFRDYGQEKLLVQPRPS